MNKVEKMLLIPGDEEKLKYLSENFTIVGIKTTYGCRFLLGSDEDLEELMNTYGTAHDVFARGNYSREYCKSFTANGIQEYKDVVILKTQDSNGSVFESILIEEKYFTPEEFLNQTEKVKVVLYYLIKYTPFDNYIYNSFGDCL